MPAVVACPKCKAKYNLPDQLIGKPVQCKGCGTRFQVGKPKSALISKKAGAGTVANPVSPQQRAEMTKLGISGPLQSRPDLFASGPISPVDPLANHVVQDPGFGESQMIDSQASEQAPDEADDEFAAMFTNPAIEASKSNQKATPKVDPLAQYLKKDLEDGGLEPLAGPQKVSNEKTSWLRMGLLLIPYIFAFVLAFFSTSVSGFMFWGVDFLVFVVACGLQWRGATLVSENSGSTALAILSFIFWPLLLIFSIIYWNGVRPTKWFLFAYASLFFVACIGVMLQIIATIYSAHLIDSF